MSTKLIYQLWVEYPDGSWGMVGYFTDTYWAKAAHRELEIKREVENLPKFRDMKVIEVREVWL